MRSGSDGGRHCGSESESERENGTWPWLKMQPQRGTVSDGGHGSKNDGGHGSKNGGDLGVAISNVSDHGGGLGVEMVSANANGGGSGVEMVNGGDHSHGDHGDRRNDLGNGTEVSARCSGSIGSSWRS